MRSLLIAVALFASPVAAIADVVVALVDTTVIRGNPEAIVDLVILGGEPFLGGTFAIQIKRPGTDTSQPDDPSDDAHRCG
jgi:hypothetical protein